MAMPENSTFVTEYIVTSTMAMPVCAADADESVAAAETLSLCAANKLFLLGGRMEGSIYAKLIVKISII